MASNWTLKVLRGLYSSQRKDMPREPQRLMIERDLATARRAIYRALDTCEHGAYYGIEDALHILNADLAAIMDAVMRGKESPTPRVTRRA